MRPISFALALPLALAACAGGGGSGVLADASAALAIAQGGIAADTALDAGERSTLGLLVGGSQAVIAAAASKASGSAEAQAVAAAQAAVRQAMADLPGAASVQRDGAEALQVLGATQTGAPPTVQAATATVLVLTDYLAQAGSAGKATATLARAQLEAPR